MLCDMERLVSLTNKRSVLILLQHTHKEETAPCIPAVRESISNIIGFVSLGDEQYLPFIIANAAGIVDTVMIDVDTKRTNSDQIRRTATRLAREKGIAVAYYSDYSTWVSSAISFMLELEQETGSLDFDCRRLLIGRNTMATKMVLEMINRGMEVWLYGKEYPSPVFPTAGGEMEVRSSYIHIVDNLSSMSFNTLIGCELQRKTHFLDDLCQVHFDMLYDVGTNNFTQDFVSHHRAGGAQVYRSDDRAGISGIVVSLMETGQLVRSRLGRTEIGSIPVVSGGYVGECGDVVVDNFNDAHSILGIANGDGTFKEKLTEDDVQKINKIKILI